QGGHRRGPWRRFSPDGQDYLTVLSPLSFLFDLSAGNHVLEEIEEIHRLVHEIPGDPIPRIESKHEFQVVDLPHAHQIRDGALRRRRARGLAVMTSLSHSEGHRFESGRAHCSSWSRTPDRETERVQCATVAVRAATSTATNARPASGIKASHRGSYRRCM